MVVLPHGFFSSSKDTHEDDQFLVLRSFLLIGLHYLQICNSTFFFFQFWIEKYVVAEKWPKKIFQKYKCSIITQEKFDISYSLLLEVTNERWHANCQVFQLVYISSCFSKSFVFSFCSLIFDICRKGYEIFYR